MENTVRFLFVRICVCVCVCLVKRREERRENIFEDNRDRKVYLSFSIYHALLMMVE